VILEPFEPVATLSAIERHRATKGFFAPTMLNSLLEEEARSGRRDLESMRQITLSYEISESLRERIEARFPGILHYGYGSTEGGMSVTRDGSRFLADPTCVGKPNGIDIFGIMSEDGRLLPAGEEAEIVVAGPDVMLGYLDDAVSTSEALHGGWLHTGDLGYIDAGGDLHYTGRFKDMIKSGGVSVAAAEVERCLTGHPAVRDAAVVGLPDEHWGEAVHAVIEAEPGQQVDVEELGALCQKNLAAFKRPKSITVVDALPRNPGGKVAKGVLKQSLAGGA
jgi:acyl-CoA synthetase (AMP-forming)/AMP-acid ligase II